MLAKAATITLTVHVDIDTLKPELSLKVDLDESFSFLAAERGVLAGWMEVAARDVRDSVESARDE